MMAGLFERLAARTLTETPSLRPAGVVRFAPVAEAGDGADRRVPSAPATAVAQLNQAGPGINTDVSVSTDARPGIGRDVPATPAFRHEQEPGPSEQRSVVDPTAATATAAVAAAVSADSEVAPRVSPAVGCTPDRVRRSAPPPLPKPGDEAVPATAALIAPTSGSGHSAAAHPAAWTDPEHIDQPWRPSLAAAAPETAASLDRESAVPRSGEKTAAAPPAAGELAMTRAAVSGRQALPAEPTTVQVSIGRLEVRAPRRPSTPGPEPWSEGPMLSLREYARRRKGSG